MLRRPERPNLRTDVQGIEQGFGQSSKQLTSLGLTPREAQVLVWVARGKSNYDIGVILGAKPRTICKHVEHILSKLNVENRTAAAAMAFAVCNQLLDFL
jgi:DNA-binding CsgD family transcriptional regulator